MDTRVNLGWGVPVVAESSQGDIHFGVGNTNVTSFLNSERKRTCKEIDRIIALLEKKPLISEDDKTNIVVAKVGKKLFSLLGPEYHIFLNPKISDTIISDDPTHIPAGFMKDFIGQMQDSNSPQLDIENTYRNFVGITGFPQLSKVYINNANLESAEYVELIAYIEKTLHRLNHIFLDGYNQAKEVKLNETISTLEIKERESDEYISSLQSENIQLTKITLTDTLTGIPNRFAMEEYMKGLIAQESKIGIIALDIDRFKNINDNYGHNVGDAILIKLAEVIKNKTRDYLKLEGIDDDIVFRTGGEEFFIFFPCELGYDAYIFAEFIRKSVIEADLAQFIDNADKDTLVSISVGYLMLDDKGEDSYSDRIKEAIKRADAAMYIAKRNGRNCSVEGTQQALVDARFEKAKLIKDSPEKQVAHSKLDIRPRAFRK